MANRGIKGIVTSVNGGELIGVSVRVMPYSTGLGTSTDFDGKYNLNIPLSTQQLEFKYESFLTKVVTIGESGELNVQLEGACDLT